MGLGEAMMTALFWEGPSFRCGLFGYLSLARQESESVEKRKRGRT